MIRYSRQQLTFVAYQLQTQRGGERYFTQTETICFRILLNISKTKNHNKHMTLVTRYPRNELTKSTMRQSHIPKCPIKYRDVHISILNHILWDMGRVYCGNYAIDLLVKVSITINAGCLIHPYEPNLSSNLAKSHASITSIPIVKSFLNVAYKIYYRVLCKILKQCNN